MPSSIVIEQKDAVLELVLNSPETGNIVTEDMAQTLEQTLRNVGSEIKLLRLRATGDHFCR